MLFKATKPKRGSAKQMAVFRLAAISVVVGLALTALIEIGISVRQNLASRIPVRIRGTLSEADRVEVLKLVRREMWQRSFPGFSWATIRMAPVSLFRIGNARLNEILVAPQPSPYDIQVAGRFCAANRYWLLRRGPNGWTVIREQPTPGFEVFEGRVEDLLAGLDHGKVQAPPLRQSLQGDRKEVPMLFFPPGSTLPKRPAKDFDGGASFSNWTSNHAGLSLEGSR